MEERVVRFRPRAVLIVLGVPWRPSSPSSVVWVTRDVLIWVAIAIFLAMALNPAVDWLQTRGLRRRGASVAVVFVGAVLTVHRRAARSSCRRSSAR